MNKGGSLFGYYNSRYVAKTAGMISCQVVL